MRSLPVALSLALAALSCCGYSTRSLLPPHLGSVAVPPVENTTTMPGLDDEFTVKLTEAFRRDRNLRVTTLEDADLVATVSLTAYSRNASSYDGNQEISAYEVSVSARVEAQDQVRDEMFYAGTVTAHVTYDPAAETEEQAASRALVELGDETVRRIITAW